MSSAAYWEKLKDPRWQKKRLQILERDRFKCVICGASSKELHVHHKYYRSGFDPWEYGNDTLTTVCCDCHDTADCLRVDLALEVARLSIDSQRQLFHIVAMLNADQFMSGLILHIIMLRFQELTHEAEAWIEAYEVEAKGIGNETDG
jgi:hypothetical protein